MLHLMPLLQTRLLSPGILKDSQDQNTLNMIRNYDPDFIFLSEPMLFQCDVGIEMSMFHGLYNSSLSSDDLFDECLPLKKSKCKGGTMIMWKKTLEQYTVLNPSPSSSFLSITYSPPKY